MFNQIGIEPPNRRCQTMLQPDSQPTGVDGPHNLLPLFGGESVFFSVFVFVSFERAEGVSGEGGRCF